MKIIQSLQYRNFRLYLMGQTISLIGTWMQQLAISWLVYRLTNSSFWLGIVTFATQIPTFVLGLFAGVLVDRVNRHKLLIWVQCLFTIQALLLATLTLSGHITLSWLIGLGLIAGILNAVDMPTRQSFVVQMIGDKKDLANAIALNSSVMHGTRLIGPAIAGILVATVGEGVCFLLNAVSFIAVIFALLSMKALVVNQLKPAEPLLHSLREGYKAAFGFAPISKMLILLSFVSLFGLAYNTLFPQFATQVLHGDAHTLGMLTAFAGLGAFTGSIYLATRKNILYLGKFIGVGTCLFGLSLVGFAISHTTVPAAFFVFCTGVTMMLQLASSNTLIQTLVEDDRRGRVMSFYTLCIMGISPFGNLLMGGAAEKYGITKSLCVLGSICFVGGVWFLFQRKELSRQVAPIYKVLGLVTDPVPEGVF